MSVKRTDYLPFKVTQGGVANKATRIQFLKGTQEVEIVSPVGNTYLSPAGTEGEDIDAGAYMIKAGESRTLQLPHRKYGTCPVIFIANDTADTGTTRLDPSPGANGRHHNGRR